MSVEAEQYLLGCAISNDEYVFRLLEIEEEKFTLNAHKLLYRTIINLNSQGLRSDVISVIDELERIDNLNKAGGAEYLTQIAENAVSFAHWDSYLRFLNDSYLRLQLVEIVRNIDNSLLEKSRPEKILAYLQTHVVKLLTELNHGGAEKLSKYLDDALAELEWRQANPGVVKGQETGLKELDRLIDGFNDGVVHIVAGRTSMGKTAFALFLVSLLSLNKPWYYFSLEMTGKSLATRLITAKSKISNRKMKLGGFTDGDYAALAAAVTRLDADNQLFIDETPNLSTGQMRSRLKAFQVKHGEIGGFLVDHVGLVKKPPGKGDTEALTEISHQIAIMAKEFSCPAIEVVQINRGVENLTNKRPSNSHLKNSGAFEEDARVIMLLYRDEYYNEDTTEPNVTEVNFSKNSDGETKTIYFRHDLSCGFYEPLINFTPDIFDDESDKYNL